MATKVENLRELYIDMLKDIYSAETQLTKALPKMAKAAGAKELQQAFEAHLKETEEHVKRLDKLFESFEKSPRGEKCQAMEGLVEEGEDLIKKKDVEPDVLDAGLIAAAQKVEHYEISSYGTVRRWAELLGDSEGEKLLRQTLDEEKKTDEKLNKLAMSGINEKALH